MQDAFTFAPGTTAANPATFSQHFSYHEIQFITIVGNISDLSVADIVGYRLFSDLERTGQFQCGSDLLTQIYDTTVNNYQVRP